MTEEGEKRNYNLDPKPLWTRDFTIITLGSVVSMLGSTLAGFAMSLLVLDYTGSTFYYALYNIIYFFPQVVMPVLSGPFLDRFSRRKTIYTLDFMTSALYIVYALIIRAGLLNFTVLAIGNFTIGTISSIYQVAYQSFYPMLISEGNYSKAYSVASTLETLTMVMVPFSALLYNTLGITVIFCINAAFYFIAAVFETQIKQREEYIDQRAAEDADSEDAVSANPFASASADTAVRRHSLRSALSRFGRDFKEGMAYLASEKGLLAVAVYFTFSFLTGGAGQSLTLPYFRGAFENGEYIYMIVWGASSLARALGGAWHYNHRLPLNRKYDIAFFVYIAISVIGGTYLYMPIPVMAVMCAANGVLGVTSYNIRISATQRYVPDGKKGRFNGAFNTLSMIGMLLGEFIAGALSLILPIRTIISIFEAVCFAAALIFIGGNREAVSKVYNTQD